jgi:Glyoxalase-like domain
VASLRDVVIDCQHPASIARFWAAALDGYEIAPYDEAELERLRGIGITDPDDDPSVLVQAPGIHPRLCFQRVPEATHTVPKTKNKLTRGMRGGVHELAMVTGRGTVAALWADSISAAPAARLAVNSHARAFEPVRRRPIGDGELSFILVFPGTHQRVGRTTARSGS